MIDVNIMREIMMNKSKFLAVNLARFLMKTVGFWTADTFNEQRLLNAIFVYTIIVIIMALWIEAYDFYISMGEFDTIMYTACSVIPIVLIIIKIIIFFRNRKDMMKLIRYTENNFWFKKYDEFGEKIMKNINKKGSILICCFTCCNQTTVYTYIMTPIIENIGKNESERILPFNMWLGGVDTHLSPYFEIAFVLEVAALVHAAFLFCCFDIFLCLLNLTLAGQFRMLQHRLEILLDKSVLCYMTQDKVCQVENAQETFEEFKRCVKQHHMLIDYVEEIEKIFSMATLCQLLISAILLCIAGFQVFLARGILMRRLIFIAYVNGCFFQVFGITLAANEVIIESRAVSNAAYNANWQILSYKLYKKIRMGIITVMIRANRPCNITAGGFFPVSLETFMAVLNTAASYFALIRKFYEDEKSKGDLQ